MKVGGTVSISRVVATSERGRGAIPPGAVSGSLPELYGACIFKTLLNFVNHCLEMVTLYLIVWDSCSKWLGTKNPKQCVHGSCVEVLCTCVLCR